MYRFGTSGGKRFRGDWLIQIYLEKAIKCVCMYVCVFVCTFFSSHVAISTGHAVCVMIQFVSLRFFFDDGNCANTVKKIVASLLVFLILLSC